MLLSLKQVKALVVRNIDNMLIWCKIYSQQGYKCLFVKTRSKKEKNEARNQTSIASSLALRTWGIISSCRTIGNAWIDLKYASRTTKCIWYEATGRQTKRWRRHRSWWEKINCSILTSIRFLIIVWAIRTWIRRWYIRSYLDKGWQKSISSF